MLVYRICCREEVDYLLNHSNFNGVGYSGENHSRSTHRYEKGCFYMHFFLASTSIIYYHFHSGNYVCTYEIPDELVLQGKGDGDYYLGDDFTFGRTCLDETAIKSEDMKIEYLKKVELILPPLRSPGFRSIYETIYEAPDFLSLERKRGENQS